MNALSAMSGMDPSRTNTAAPASWDLVAPDWGELDTIRRSPWPFVLWSVCDKPLLAHWLDEAVRRGIPDIRILAVDRPHLIREWLETQNIWSREIEILSDPQAGEGSREEGREVCFLGELPGMNRGTDVMDAKSLLFHWLDLHREAIRRRSTSVVHLDHEVQPGVWLGPGVKAAPDAVLTAPCWVGSYARIGPGCRLGPDAFVGPGSFLDEDVEVVSSLVCADTYVGAHTSLEKMIAQGGLLLDLERANAVEITDRLMLGSIGAMDTRPTLGERILAAALGPFLRLAAGIVDGGKAPVLTKARLGRSREITLATHSRGPLLLRRAGWLRHVAAGEMRWVGVLPRSEQDWAVLPADVSASIEAAPTGVFSLADLHGSHSPENPDEWIHASYQAASPDGMGARMARRSVFRIALSHPSRL